MKDETLQARLERKHIAEQRYAQRALASAVRCLADFSILHAAFVLSGHADKFKGMKAMALASKDARQVIEQWERRNGKHVRTRRV